MKTIIAVLLILASPALAGTYARVGGGQALDVISGKTLADALAGRFADNYKPQPYWTQVPDTDTDGKPLTSGAKSNGNGTFTNPPAPVAVVVDAPLDKAAFQALLAANGNDLAATLTNWPKVQK